MAEAHGYLKALLGNLQALRERAGLTEEALEEQLILGPGWIGRFERGQTVPSIDMLLAILHATHTNLRDLLDGLPEPEPAAVERRILPSSQATTRLSISNTLISTRSTRCAAARLNSLKWS